MQIPRRPQELRTTLKEHVGLDDAPIFVYRFPTPEEEAERLFEVVSKLTADPQVAERLAALEDRGAVADEIRRIMGDESGSNRAYGRYLCELFDAQIERIEGLDIGGEPFDRALHLGDIPGKWKIEVARDIQTRLDGYLTEAEEGNSSSPSSSGDERMMPSPGTADAAADDAS